MKTMQLMNAEFNVNNKKLGRDMMKAAEKIELYQESNMVVGKDIAPYKHC